MDWPDLVILATIAISLLVGALRGFVKEAFSLAVWAIAFMAAFQFSAPIAEWLEPSISLPSARTALAFAGLFVSVLIVGGLLTYLVGELVEKTGLTGTDRMLGGLFGAARGVILVVMMILVAGFTPVPRDPWFGESKLISAFMPMVEWSLTLLPEAVTRHMELHPEAEKSSAAA